MSIKALSAQLAVAELDLSDWVLVEEDGGVAFGDDDLPLHIYGDACAVEAADAKDLQPVLAHNFLTLFASFLQGSSTDDGQEGDPYVG